MLDEAKADINVQHGNDTMNRTSAQKKWEPVRQAQQVLKDWLSPNQKALAGKIQRNLKALMCPSDLCNLAHVYGSDKWLSHWYALHYQQHFASLRRKRVTLLEIGVWRGASLRMWKRYFPNGRICGIDICDTSADDEDRIQTFRGDQSDEKFLRKVIMEIGTPDIVIDDGSHINSHVIKTFQVLFPLLADDGIYVIEDTQTSYWTRYGGSSEDLITAPTSMCMLKGLTDGLNYQEFICPGYTPSYFDQHIVSLHFYHNLIFVYKGDNREGTMVDNNKPIDGVTEP